MLCLYGIAACSTAAPPATQVIVRIDGDDGVRALSELRVELYRADATSESQAVERRPFGLTTGTPRTGQVRLPFSFVIARGRADRFLLVVSGYRAGSAAPHIEQKVIASFREQQTELLQVYLSSSCLETVCESLQQTCRAASEDALTTASCAPVRVLETTPIEPGGELDLPGSSPGGMDRDAAGEASDHDAGAVDAHAGPSTTDSSPREPPEAGIAAPSADAGGDPPGTEPDAAADAAPAVDCGTSPMLAGCGARCAAANVCSSPDYPCVELGASGYTCEGQLADWPMPDSSPGAKHPASYDAASIPGVLIDNVTKLQWQRTPPESLTGCQSDRVLNGSPRAASYACTWQEATQYCAQLELGGLRNWRLPSVIEALSLADDARQSPAIDPLFYRTDAEKESAWYMIWTASSDVNDPASAWVVDFSYGAASHAKRQRTDPLRLRCVHSGASLGPATYTPAQRYQVDEAAGSVTDTRTGLTWEQPISARKYDRDGAATHCSMLGAGYRVPTRKELLTLVDFTREQPAVVAAFPNTPAELAYGTQPSDWFWTTTPWFLLREGAESRCTASTCFLTVEFASGLNGLASPTMVDLHPSQGYVRCVK